VGHILISDFLRTTQGVGFSLLPTVLRSGGFRITIYFNDHPPPHVHVAFGGRTAKIYLDPNRESDAAGLRWIELARMRRVVAEHHDILLVHWNRMHEDE
jgi:hypothetical protein